MKKRLLCFLAFLTFSCLTLNAQKWGYVTLIAKSGTNSVSLIDTNNNVVKQWNNLSGNTGYSTYMLPGGTLWRTVKPASTSFNGGGICGKVQKVDWNGNVLFDYEINTTNLCSHHDICPMPNGNVLVISYERKTAAEVQAAGCSVNAIRWSEAVFELKPTGLNTATIVWEWHLWDHLVQNQYPAKANYQTSIVDHPELLNVNYNNTMTDWVHMNGIDYNAELDQIVVSSHFLNEMYVIDHSTTTAQAATHSGGNSGHGGDFLYRWGNPAAYGATGTAVLNVVHDAHWVPKDCPRAGWLAGFNNRGVSNSNSSIDLFDPPNNGYNYDRTAGQAYQPTTYGYRHPANGYSSNMGNSQQLPNGNMLVCLATASKVYEINSNGTQVWSYTTNQAIPQAWRHTRCYMENPTASTAGLAPTICSGNDTQLDVSATATNVNSFSYQWAPADGLSDPTVKNPLVQDLRESTIYTVTVSTPGGCTVTATVPVTVLPAPQADAGADLTIETGQTTSLNAGGGTSYLWSNGLTGATIEVSPSVTTTYTVTVTDAGNCTATDEVTVTVLPVVTVSPVASDNDICIGGSVSLTAGAANGTGLYTYQWASTPAGFSSSAANPVATPSASTVYHVTVSDGLASTSASVGVTVNPLPVADAGADQLVPFGSSTILMASGGDTYAWSSGETTQSFETFPEQTTTYTVTVTSAAGCTATDEVTTIVTGTALTMVNSVDDATLCVGMPAHFTTVVTGGTGLYTYQWTTDGQVVSTVPEFTLYPTTSGFYYIQVSDGNQTIYDTMYMQVTPPPVVEAGADLFILSGESVTLNASGGLTYEWSNGDVGASITVMPPTTTVYSVTATDNFGCQGVDEVTVTVSNPPLELSISASQTSICAGQSVQLTANISGGTGQYSYVWSSQPAGFFSTETNPVVTPVVQIVYLLQVSDGNNSIAAEQEILVNPLPTVDAGADQTILTGQSAILTASGADEYLWSTTETTTSILVQPTTTTTYTVWGTSAAGCQNFDQVTVVVQSPDPLSATISAADPAICTGEITQLFVTASGGTGNYTYEWSSDPTGFSSTLPDPFINPEFSTVYTVVVSDGVSSTTLHFSVTVFPLPPQPVIFQLDAALISSSEFNNQWFFYGSLIPGATDQFYMPTLPGSYQVQVSDVNGCFSLLSEPIEVVGVSVRELSASSWQIFPNPAKDRVYIRGDFDVSNSRVTLWNSDGALILEAENTREIDLSNMPAGVYALRLSTPQGAGTRVVIVH